jgi:methionine synthase II (cobalamin-independent)
VRYEETRLHHIAFEVRDMAELESADVLKRRIEEASQFIKLEQLALSPQCGFSTSATQHLGVGEAGERAKLARIVEVSRAVWED